RRRVLRIMPCRLCCSTAQILATGINTRCLGRQTALVADSTAWDAMMASRARTESPPAAAARDLGALRALGEDAWKRCEKIVSRQHASPQRWALERRAFCADLRRSCGWTAGGA